MVFERLLFDSPEEGDPVGLLVLAGLIRDDIPWMYELTVEAYRTIKSGSNADISRLMRTLQDPQRSILEGPFREEFVDSPEMDMMVHELPRMLCHRLEIALHARKSKSRSVK